MFTFYVAAGGTAVLVHNCETENNKLLKTENGWPVQDPPQSQWQYITREPDMFDIEGRGPGNPDFPDMDGLSTPQKITFRIMKALQALHSHPWSSL
jgi:hypothetical protein